MPQIFNNNQKQWLAKKGKTFYFTKGIIVSHGSLDYMFKSYVTIDEAQKIHEGFGGGHFATNITTKKIINVGY
jgi:hypothetical protein